MSKRTSQITATVAPAPAVETAATPKALTEFQELVCSLVGDLILNGGNQRDVGRLIEAVLSHSYRQQYKTSLRWLRETEEAREAEVQSYADHFREEWVNNLVRHWPEKRESQQTPPVTASQKVMANIRGDLSRKFEDFLGDARAHELYLLNDVLLNFAGENRGNDHDGAESILAEAFMEAMDSDHTYVKVQSGRQLELVEEYIALLNQGQDKAA